MTTKAPLAPELAKSAKHVKKEAKAADQGMGQQVGAIMMVALAALTEHPQANLIPDIGKRDFVAFRGHIKVHGVRVPIEVVRRPDGSLVIVDGHHRFRAARDLGLDRVPIRVVDIKPEDEVQYMLDAALFRRHLSAEERRNLSDDQRAILAAAKGSANPKPRGGPRRKQTHSHSRGKGKAARNPALAEAAEAEGVSVTKALKAKELLTKAPDLAGDVGAGRKTLPEARKELKDREVQEAIASGAPAIPKVDKSKLSNVERSREMLKEALQVGNAVGPLLVFLREFLACAEMGLVEGFSPQTAWLFNLLTLTGRVQGQLDKLYAAAQSQKDAPVEAHEAPAGVKQPATSLPADAGSPLPPPPSIPARPAAAPAPVPLFPVGAQPFVPPQIQPPPAPIAVPAPVPWNPPVPASPPAATLEITDAIAPDDFDEAEEIEEGVAQ